MNTLESEVFQTLSPSVFSDSGLPNLDETVRSIFETIYLPISKRIPIPYFLDRLASGIFYRMPQLLGLGRDLSQMNALEIGCGRGLKSVPWSTLFRRYWGVDIIGDDIALANGSARATGRDNLDFILANAVEVMRNPRRFGVDEKIDCIIMYAVLEHLTLSERKEVLRATYEALFDGGLLIVAETPNRIIAHDGHSTYLHFFQSLPPELAIAYINRSPREDARNVVSSRDKDEALYRFGVGASYHEFELFMADSEGRLPAIVNDGWSFWQTFDEPVRRDEVAMAAYFQDHGALSQPAFARFWIEAVFDFGRKDCPTRFPRLVLPDSIRGIDVQSRPQCWTLDLMHCRSSGRLDFNLSGVENGLLQFDINESSGAFALFDSKDQQLAEYSVDRLRSARLARWHTRCALDLSRYPDLTRLSVRPIGADSTIAVEGVVGRQSGV